MEESIAPRSGMTKYRIHGALLPVEGYYCWNEVISETLNTVRSQRPTGLIPFILSVLVF
jgi:hypothetical protein